MDVEYRNAADDRGSNDDIRHATVDIRGNSAPLVHVGAGPNHAIRTRDMRAAAGWLAQKRSYRSLSYPGMMMLHLGSLSERPEARAHLRKMNGVDVREEVNSSAVDNEVCEVRANQWVSCYGERLLSLRVDSPADFQGLFRSRGDALRCGICQCRGPLRASE